MTDSVVKDAQECCKYGLEFEDQARDNFIDDLKFAYGDDINCYQWREADRTQREDPNNPRPVLTINKVRQHNLSIINDARQNKPGIKFMATGNGATFQAAQVWSAWAKRIEANSNAGDAYDLATGFMVNAGIGYARVVTDYVSPNSFLQHLLIVPVNDPLKVLQDPSAQQLDKSDSKFGLIFEDVPRDEFERYMPKKYHELAKVPNAIPLAGSWITDKNVRTAEFFRVEETQTTLLEVGAGDPNSPTFTIFLDEVPKDILDEWKEYGFILRSRPSAKRVVKWYYIIGDQIVERNIWPGQTIPIIPFIAEELILDGRVDRKSHTRSMRDPQRMYNWYAAASVEYGAMQTKTPYIAPAEAIDGVTNDWLYANRDNKPVLTYNAYTEEGNPIPAPQRIPPPISAPLAIEGMKVAAEEMSMVSGQYESQMGAPSNERSGKAINQRQRMGDRSTYHYIEAVARAVRLVGKIVKEVAPKIYTEKQVLQLLAEDGTSMEVLIDPRQKEAYVMQMGENQQVVARIFNPGVGDYDVIADVGPGYATRREETFNALVLLLTQAPQLANVVGDLLFRAGDFEYADEAAERLRRMVPPQALGQGPSQQEQLLMAQIEQLKQLLAKVMDENAKTDLKLASRDVKRDVDIYRAFTERLKVLQDAKEESAIADRDHAEAVVQLMRDMLGDDLQASQESVDSRLAPGEGMQPTLSATPPVPGAQAAPDGKHYVPDPLRPGKYLQVVETPDA